jgi:hypothetical protein
MSRLIALLVTTISASAVVLACTVTTTHEPGGSSSGETPKEAGSSSGTSGSSGDGGGSGTGDGGGTGDGKCKNEGAQCFDCCIDKHQAGNKTFDDAFVACACGAQGACSTECADSACATPSKLAAPQSPCDLCLAAAFADTGECGPKQKTACDKDPDCIALYTCTGKCPQQ